MKRQVRRNVFETNSSSVHSITMCKKSEFDAWQNGDLLLFTGYRSDYNCSNPPIPDCFYSRAQAIEYQKQSEWYEEGEVDFSDNDVVNTWLRENEWYDYDSYGGGYEEFYDEYTTESGETVVAFGYYGGNY